MSSPNPARSALAEKLLQRLPETLPLRERIKDALTLTKSLGAVNMSVLRFLVKTTLKDHWNPEDARQTAQLHAMVTKAIAKEYENWDSFRTKDLHPYLEEFGYAKFVDGQPVPSGATTQAHSENSGA